MTHYEIIKKLIGPIEPLGDASRDPERLQNLKEITNLTERLVQYIHSVSRHESRQEYSVKLAGKLARECIDEIKLIIESEAT